MKREIRRIEPFSAVRIGFFLGIGVGIVVGLVEALMIKSLSSSPAGASLLPAEAQQMMGMSGGTVIVMAVVMGLVFSLVFACIGAVMAFIYNLTARLFGGLELELSGDEELRTEPAAVPSDVPEDEEHHV